MSVGSRDRGRATQRARIATFNIRHGLGSDGVVDLERTARAIEATGADVVVLQEVDRGWRRSGWIDQPTRLAELTGMAIQFFATLERERQQFGLAIAAREPLPASFRPLPSLGEDRPHGVVMVRCKGLVVLGTHLSRRPATRAVELSALASWSRELEAPVAIAGDLNCERSGLGALEEAGFSWAGDVVATHPAPAPARQIDFVLAGPKLEVSRARAMAGDASDHLALVADLELRDGAAT